MTISRSERVIRIAAAIVIDGNGRTLLVRKTGTEAFMQPGGKLNDGESAAQALHREVSEELGCRVQGIVQELGRFAAPAANEPGCTVEADLFAITIEGEVRAGAEIAEVIWHDPADRDTLSLAPLTREHVLPMVLGMKA